jgi:4-hydroxy-3-polyprenylbenzoate decarboxylase
MNGLWGQGLMSLAKVIVVVDHDVDVKNAPEVWWYALNNIDPERDIVFTYGPADDLDHAARGPAFGSKMGIDGTRKWAEEGAPRPWPEVIRMDAAVRQRIDALWPKLGIAP